MTVMKCKTVAPPRPKNDTADTAGGFWQSWQRAGRCPKGTIPIRRATVENVLPTKPFHRYGKKQGKTSPLPSLRDNLQHQHAVAYIKQEIYGAKATINIWQPSVEDDREMSLSQIWLLSGDSDSPDLNTIEAGIMVYPNLFYDRKPRLFVYWTRDGYGTTGCYNLFCPGFVQISETTAMGTDFHPISSYSGQQYDTTILIWKDPRTGNWWLSLQGQAMGYWPSEIFTSLTQHAEAAEWGGEVINLGTNGKHTTTQMGSGHFAEEGFRRASFFRNLQTVDSKNGLSGVDVGSVSTLAEASGCYNIKLWSGGEWGTHFYYGGPGNNPNCP